MRHSLGLMCGVSTVLNTRRNSSYLADLHECVGFPKYCIFSAQLFQVDLILIIIQIIVLFLLGPERRLRMPEMARRGGGGPPGQRDRERALERANGRGQLH